EGTAPRRAAHVVRVEHRACLVPERARLAGRPVVARGLAHEVEALRGPRAGGVEEVAVAADGIRPLEPASELAAAVVVEERRTAAPRLAARAAPRAAPRAAARSPPRPGRARGRRARAAGPRRSRCSRVRSPSRASAGTRTARAAQRPPRRNAAARAERGPGES